MPDFRHNFFQVAGKTTAEVTSLNQIIVLADFDDTLATTISSAKRYVRTNSADTGVDISSRLSTSGQEITIANIFTALETPAAGDYLVYVSAVNNAVTRSFTMGIIISA